MTWSHPVLLFVALLSAVVAAQTPQPGSDAISGRWGQDGQTLLDMKADTQGVVTGTIYIYQGPSQYTAPIGTGRFDAKSRSLTLEGHATLGDGVSRPYLIEATLDQDTLHANYTFGDQSGSVSMKKTGPPGRSHQAS